MIGSVMIVCVWEKDYDSSVMIVCVWGGLGRSGIVKKREWKNYEKPNP